MSIDIEKNIESRRQTDRLMWFSMWILLSITTFGIAWVLMVYFLVKRRNAHFARQEKLQVLILNELRHLKTEKQPNCSVESYVKETQNQAPRRNAYAWALSALLIIPAFYIFLFLNHDLQRHEQHERAFVEEAVALTKDLGFELHVYELATKKYALKSYLTLSIITLGVATIYWLYRVFNDYNRHFKKQWTLEDELVDFLKPENVS